jgi:hypothetical protein
MEYQDILDVSMLALSSHVRGRPIQNFHVLGLESCIQVCQDNIWFDRPSKFGGRTQEPVWQVSYYPNVASVTFDNTGVQAYIPELVKFKHHGIDVVGKPMYWHMWTQAILNREPYEESGTLVTELWVTFIAKVNGEVVAYNQYYEGGVVTAVYDPEPDDIKDTDVW